MMRPEENITRQEAAIMLANALHIPYSSVSSTGFADNADIADWAKGAVYALKSLGLVSGVGGNNFDPTAPISRAAVTTILSQGIDLYINEAGTYSETSTGTVVIRSESVNLSDTHITGDLILAEGIADGDISLDGVRIDGDLIVKGGGNNSIYLNDAVITGNVNVDKAESSVRVVFSGASTAYNVNVKNDARVITQDLTGSIGKVSVQGGSNVVLDGIFTAVENLADTIALAVSGEVGTLTNAAEGVSLTVDATVDVVENTGAGLTLEITGEVKALDNQADELALNVGENGTITEVNNTGANADIVVEGTVGTVTTTEDLSVNGDTASAGDTVTDVSSSGSTITPGSDSSDSSSSNTGSSNTGSSSSGSSSAGSPSGSTSGGSSSDSDDDDSDAPPTPDTNAPTITVAGYSDGDTIEVEAGSTPDFYNGTAVDPEDGTVDVSPEYRLYDEGGNYEVGYFGYSVYEHLQTLGNKAAVVYTAKDSYNNSSSFTLNYLSVDNTAPYISAQYDGRTYYTDSSINIREDDASEFEILPRVEDNADGLLGDGDSTVAYSSTDSGSAVTDLASARLHLGTKGNTVNVTVTATDKQNNTGKLVLTFVSVDNETGTEYPVITVTHGDNVYTSDDSIQLELSELEAFNPTVAYTDNDTANTLTTTVSFVVNGTSYDSLEDAKVYFETATFTTLCVTYTAEDAAGNKTTLQLYVYVYENPIYDVTLTAEGYAPVAGDILDPDKFTLNETKRYEVAPYGYSVDFTIAEAIDEGFTYQLNDGTETTLTATSEITLSAGTYTITANHEELGVNASTTFTVVAGYREYDLDLTVNGTEITVYTLDNNDGTESTPSTLADLYVMNTNGTYSALSITDDSTYYAVTTEDGETVTEYKAKSDFVSNFDVSKVTTIKNGFYNMTVDNTGTFGDVSLEIEDDVVYAEAGGTATLTITLTNHIISDNKAILITADEYTMAAQSGNLTDGTYTVSAQGIITLTPTAANATTVSGVITVTFTLLEVPASKDVAEVTLLAVANAESAFLTKAQADLTDAIADAVEILATGNEDSSKSDRAVYDVDAYDELEEAHAIYAPDVVSVTDVKPIPTNDDLLGEDFDGDIGDITARTAEYDALIAACVALDWTEYDVAVAGR